MKTLKSLMMLLLCLSIMFTLSHCTSDDSEDPTGDPTGGGDEPMEDQISITDPDAVTDAITITGATVQAGDPPAPSTDPDAPVISQDSDEVISAQGQTLQLDLDVTSGDVAGIYLQIPGADSYFDIPASAFTGGRLLQSDPGFGLEIPDNIEPGEFCVDLCVYDSETRVSNIVQVCITVGELGGENSDFLIGTWDIIQIVEEYDGMTETFVIGEVDTYTWETEIICADGQTFDLVTITETELYNYMRLTFSSNGALRFEQSYEDSYFDWENSTCEDVKYIEDSGIYDFDGAWSYEDTNDRLVIIINEIDEETGEEFTNAIEFTQLDVSTDGNTLVVVIDYDDGETDTITLEKQ